MESGSKYNAQKGRLRIKRESISVTIDGQVRPDVCGVVSMSEMKFGGSVSHKAMEAAMEELEEKVQGRLGEEDFDRVYGERWAKLRAAGVINNALIGGYGEKASADDGSHGLFDEKEQARLILERYDARRVTAPIKRRRKGKAAEDAKDSAAKAGLGDASAQGRGEGQGVDSRSTVTGEDKETDAPTSPYQPGDLERRL